MEYIITMSGKKELNNQTKASTKAARKLEKGRLNFN